MKKDITTVLGVVIILLTAIWLFGHMYLSTLENYKLKFEWWHFAIPFGSGLLLVVVPQKKLADLLSWAFKKIIGSKFGNGKKG